jgi:hypothetical protein
MTCSLSYTGLFPVPLGAIGAVPKDCNLPGQADWMIPYQVKLTGLRSFEQWLESLHASRNYCSPFLS